MKNNPRITPKERGLLKGAIRRVFSRSDLRRKVIEDALIEGHADPSRPRVKRWCQCAVCGKPEAKSYVAVDHVQPVIPIDSSFEELGLDATADRTWCDPKNLQAICPACHDIKTQSEGALRRKQKKEKKNGKRS